MFKRIFFLTLLGISLSYFFSASSFSAPLKLNNNPDSTPADSTRLVLDNGLVVVVKEVKTTSMATVAAFVDVGSAMENQYTGAGISHLVEHMLFKGTGSLKVGEIEQKIKSYGGNINGFTSYDYTGYQAVVYNQYLDDTLKILYGMLSEASFDPQEFEKEKGVIINEINLNLDEPEGQLQQLFFSTAYTSHPYHFPVIGQLPIFKKLIRQDALDFYHKNYVPNRTVLVVCGNVDTKKTIAKVGEIFKNWPGDFSLIRVSTTEPKQLNLRRIDKPAKVKLAHILLGFHTVSLRNDDMYPLDVLASILGSKESSRLNQEIHKKLGLVYAISAGSFTPADKGVFNIYAQTESKKVNPAISAILNEIDKVKKGQVKKEELEKAKNEVLEDYLFTRERIESLAYNLASDELIAHDLNFSQRYVEKIKAVSLEQLTKAAQKYFTTDNLTIATLFPEEEKNIIAPVSKEKEAEEGEIEKFILPNGLTILLKENHRLPIVSIKTYFLAGLRAENESNNGLSNLAADMLLAGTKSKKANQISGLIENKGGSISTISGANSIGVSVNVLNQHLDGALMVLADILTNSVFPDDELKKAKETILAEIKSQDDDVFQSASNLFKETLYQKHPYRFPVIGKEEAIKNISRDDLADFYKNYIKGRNGVLVIFGDIDKEKTLSMVKKYFKNLNSSAVSKINLPIEPERKNLTERSKILNKEQSIIMLGFKTIRVDDQDRYVLDVLSGIISGGGGKLFEEIRDKLGLAYTLGAYSVPGLDPGYYVFYVATTAENKEKVKDLLFKQIEKLKTGELSDEDLQLAKNYLIGQTQLARQTNAGLANQAALDELYGLGFNNYQEYVQKINKISRQDIKRAVDKYFNLENAALAMVSSK